MNKLQKKDNSEAPRAEGNLLAGEEVTKVARSMYNRFQHNYGLTPCWGDNKKVDENCKNQVRSVLDALEMNGYSVIKRPISIA